MINRKKAKPQLYKEVFEAMNQTIMLSIFSIRSAHFLTCMEFTSYGFTFICLPTRESHMADAHDERHKGVIPQGCISWLYILCKPYMPSFNIKGMENTRKNK